MAEQSVDRLYAYDAIASDPEGDLTIWSLDAAPAGMSVDPVRGTLRWTPEAGQTGSYEVTIRVTDALGAFSTQSFVVDARGTNLPASITSIPQTRAAANLPYGYAVVANDPEGDALSYRLTDAPEGMAIDPDTGFISWTPSLAQVGAASVTVQVTDSLGAETLQSYEIAVTDAAINQAPTITSVPDFAATSGQPYEYAVTATDPENEAIAYELLDAPAGMTIDAATGLVQWTPEAGLSETVFATVAARDARGAAASQRFGIAVAPNDAPAILSSPIATAVPDQTYRYDLIARDPNGDRLTYELVDGPAGLTIDELGRLRWSPEAGDAGSYPVTVTVTDPYGATATQSFELSVEIDDEAPVASVLPSRSPIELGQPVTLVATATDNVGVESLVVTANGVPLALDANGLTTLTPDMAGTLVVEATATDAAGNVGTSTFDVFVIDPTDTEAPVIALPDLGEISITAPTDIVGTVTDDNLDFYTLSVAPVDGGEFTEIFRGTTAVTDGVLGEFDPTLLQNDAYTLRLTAQDDGGNRVSVEETVNVEGELKLGNFQLSFEDLSIPVAGIPITLTRTYDTLTANRTDDFGYGWRMEFRDTDLRTSLGPDEVFETLGIRSQAFDDRTRVYITLPGGQREAFTFAPTVNPISAYFPPIGGSGDPTLYNPAFEAEPGVTSTLSVQNVTLSRRADGKFIGLNGGGYNPADTNYGFGGYYVLTTKEGIEYRIDAATGDLETITDRNSNTLTFSDSDITSSTGQKITFERDSRDRITSVFDPQSLEIKYQYDINGDLTSVIDRSGSVTEYIYSEDKNHYLTDIIDPLEQEVIKNKYDDQGRLTSFINSFGETIEFTYDPNNLIETNVDPLGFNTIVEYDERGNEIKRIARDGGVTLSQYDLNNNLTSTTNQVGNKELYTYDSKGNVLSQSDALGNVTRFSYDSRNLVTSIVNPLGNSTVFKYDPNGNMIERINSLGYGTKYTYDKRGLVLSVQQAADDITYFEYDSFGYLAMMTDALGNVSEFTFDRNGNQLSASAKVTSIMTGASNTLITRWEYDNEGRVKKTTDANNNVFKLVYDENGNEVESVDPLGNITRKNYDSQGQLISILLPDTTPILADNPLVTMEYDSRSNLTRLTDFEGNTTDYVYDEEGRAISHIAPDQTISDSTDNPRVSVEYDLAGKVQRTFNEFNEIVFSQEYDEVGRPTKNKTKEGTNHYLYNEAGEIITSIDATGNRVEYKYDALGQVTELIYPDLSSERYSYDYAGNVVSKTDASGRVTLYEYDQIDQLTAVVQVLENPVDSSREFLRTEYSYDELGNLVLQRDTNNNVTMYEYDANGRQTVVLLPTGEHIERTFDAVGNIIEVSDSNGDSRVKYTYNELGLLTEELIDDGTSTIKRSFTKNGNLSEVKDIRGVTKYQYDSLNRLISRIEPDGESVNYEYTKTGQIKSITTSSGVRTYEYDSLDRLASVKLDATQELASYEYDEGGNLTLTKFGNGIQESRIYDDRNRLNNISQFRSDGELLSGYSYSYDSSGNIIQIDAHDGAITRYVYDTLDRLIEEEISRPGFEVHRVRYTYDPIGNRVSQDDSLEGVTFYSYDSSNRLTERTNDDYSVKYVYDDDGNLIIEDKLGFADKVEYSWNSKNQLTETIVSNPDGSDDIITYEYDSEGNRVAKIVNGKRTNYLLQTVAPFTRVLELYTSDPEETIAYTYGLDLVSSSKNENHLFYMDDGFYTIKSITTLDANILEKFSYNAYGEVLQTESFTDNIFGYNGEVEDPDTGLQYLRARYYSPEIGRFISADPFQGITSLPLTRNLYNYANSNPVRYSDPSGNFATLSGAAATLWKVLLYAGATSSTLQVGFSFATRSGDVVDWSGLSGNRNILSPNPTEKFPVVSAGQNISLGGYAASTDFYSVPNWPLRVFKQENSIGFIMAAGIEANVRFSSGRVEVDSTGAEVGTFAVSTPQNLGPDKGPFPLTGGYFEVGGSFGGNVSLPIGSPSGFNLDINGVTVSRSTTFLTLGFGIGTASGVAGTTGRGTGFTVGVNFGAFLRTGLSFLAFPNVVPQ